MGWLHGREDGQGLPARSGAREVEYFETHREKTPEEKAAFAVACEEAARERDQVFAASLSPDGRFRMTVSVDGYPEKVSVETIENVGRTYFQFAPWEG